jgi:hypothetical protein
MTMVERTKWGERESTYQSKLRRKRTRGDGIGIAAAGLDVMTVEAKRHAEELLKLVPPDTRDLTARLCGDPLPGRRAIDLRGVSDV